MEKLPGLENLDALEQYLCDIENAIAVGALSRLTSPIELASLRLTLQEAEAMLDSQIEQASDHLIPTPVDRIV